MAQFVCIGLVDMYPYKHRLAEGCRSTRWKVVGMLPPPSLVAQSRCDVSAAPMANADGRHPPQFTIAEQSLAAMAAPESAAAAAFHGSSALWAEPLALGGLSEAYTVVVEPLDRTLQTNSRK